MTERRRQARYALVLAAALLGAGCDGGGDEQAAAKVDVDTTNRDWADGLSATQVEAEAEAMTPEEAAARGVADAGIHLENLGSQDSVPAGSRGNDTTPPAPVRDTVRNAQR